MEPERSEDAQRTRVSPGRRQEAWRYFGCISHSPDLGALPPPSAAKLRLLPVHVTITPAWLHTPLLPRTSSGRAQSPFPEPESNWPCWEPKSTPAQSSEMQVALSGILNAMAGTVGWGDMPYGQTDGEGPG